VEGLWDLRHGLQGLGSDLVMRVGRPEEVVEGLLTDETCSSMVGGVWMAKDWAFEELGEENRVREVVKNLGRGRVEWKIFDGEETLIHK
jgi:deoxyribodipyrimidine photo-lyase